MLHLPLFLFDIPFPVIMNTPTQEIKLELNECIVGGKQITNEALQHEEGNFM